MLYVVEIPHQRKSFAWVTASKEAYCQTVHDLNRSGETIYEESTFDELAKTYAVNLLDIEECGGFFELVFGYPYTQGACPPEKIYKHYGGTYWTDAPGSEFEDCCANEASDLYNYYVFEGEQEAIEGLRSLVGGHNVAAAFEELFEMLMDAGCATRLAAAGFADEVAAHEAA